ncbi:MAG: hypothetical protein WC551_02780 [Patescibacteria group bacterium]
MPKIKGGYYLKAKCIQSSYIAHAPPCVREIWDWLLMKAFHKDGDVLKRGQLICTYKDIQEGLHWYVGFRKMAYSKWDCERTMKALMKATMIATTKTTRGLVITIVNYAKYQDVKNYESHSEGHNEATMKPQTTETIEKEDIKNIKRREKGEAISSPTPAEEAVMFFEDGEKQNAFIKMLASRGVGESTARQEVSKFIAYWTERNSTGKKQRWQMEKVFDIRRRLTNWFSKSKDFSKNPKIYMAD